MLEFIIQLYFENKDGEKINKSAMRLLSKNKFVKESVDVVEKEPIEFEIREPESER